MCPLQLCTYKSTVVTITASTTADVGSVVMHSFEMFEAANAGSHDPMGVDGT
jgi:hypothetical protein